MELEEQNIFIKADIVTTEEIDSFIKENINNDDNNDDNCTENNYLNEKLMKIYNDIMNPEYFPNRYQIAELLS